MKYQIRYEKDLAIIHNTDPTWIDVAKHFAENGYAPLYIYKYGHLSYAITFDDFASLNINRSLERYFIKKYNSNLSRCDIEKAFLDDLDAEWLVYVNDGKIICEINSLIELPLQNSTSKNLMALRYIEIFHDYLASYFNSYKRILILSDFEVYKYIKDEYPDINFLYADSIEALIELLNKSQFDIIIDFIYSPKIRKYLKINSSIFVELSKILVVPALNKIIQMAQDRGVHLLFYKLPRFQDLTCLSICEKDNFRYRKKSGQLIKDNKYIKLFTRSIDEEIYLKNKEYYSSQRLDNGYCFVMDESDNPKLSVHEEVRSNGIHEIKDVSACNFYGPCTTYGFLVENCLTVPALVQQYANNEGKYLQTYNRAGIHGDNELNSLMEAMAVPVTYGDVHIFLDVLEDLPTDMYPHFFEVKRWFNKNKSVDQIQFLDFPGHCNSEANKLMARYIYDDVKTICHSQVRKDRKRNPLVRVRHDCFELLSITHSSCVKQMRILKKMGIICEPERILGAAVIPDNIDSGTCMDFINKCTKKCDFLYVFMSNDDIEFVEQNHLLYKKINSLDKLKTKEVPLEHFFNSQRYLFSKTNSEDCFKKAVYTEQVFYACILNKLKINIRFYLNKEKYCIWNRAILNAADKFCGEIMGVMA